MDLVDFIFDVADGTERPMGSRVSYEPDELQLRFQDSEYYTPVLGMRQLLSSARTAMANGYVCI